MTYPKQRLLGVVLPMLTLVATTVALNVHHAAGPLSAQLSNSSASMATGGVMQGACAIAVTAIGSVVALGIGGCTVGFGAALVIAATIQVSAVACAS